MSYAVKEIYLTLQGEGAHTGRTALFLRFTGCNLWSGREEDRANAVCKFCDTDFIGTDGENGAKFKSAKQLAQKCASLWPQNTAQKYIVCTGGEPLLQLDDALINALHEQGFEIAIETNGTLLAPAEIDWVCVSPKAGSMLRQLSGNELKLVYPQREKQAQPENYTHLSFDHFFLQPMDVIGDEAATQANIAKTIKYCQTNPQWRLSLQTHKLTGIK